MFELRPKTVHKVLKSIGAYKQGAVLEQFLLACESDFNGRLGLEDKPYPQSDLLQQCYQASKSIDAKPLMEKGYEGAELGEAIERERVRAIKMTLEKEKTAD